MIFTLVVAVDEVYVQSGSLLYLSIRYIENWLSFHKMGYVFLILGL